MTDEPKKPSWWNDKIAASWEKAKATAVAEWAKLNERTVNIAKKVAERAMAFGPGARVKFDKLSAWTDEVEKELAEEWERLGNDGEAAWSKVRETVKAQWQRASSAIQSKPSATPPPTPAPPASGDGSDKPTS